MYLRSFVIPLFLASTTPILAAPPPCPDGSSAAILSVAHWMPTRTEDGALELLISIRNRSLKSIYAATGNVSFSNAGGHLGDVSMDEDFRVGVGSTYEQTLTIRDVNGLFALLTLPHNEVTATACVTFVNYWDGQKVTF
jgi:hypothetical protein